MENTSPAQDSATPPAPQVDAGTPIMEQTLADVNEITRVTWTRLEELWDEVGYSSEERSRLLNDTLEVINGCCQDRIADETALRDETASQVEAIKAEIQTVATSIKMPFDNVPESEASSLINQLTWLKRHLEELNTVKDARMEKLNAVLQPLHAIWTELGHEFDKDFQDAGEYITDERVVQIQEKLKEVQSEKENRIKEINATIVYASHIMVELDLKPEIELDQCIMNNGEGLDIDDATVTSLSVRAKELQDLKEERTKQLSQLGALIQPLWKLLEVGMDEQQEFFVENTGLSLEVVERCQAELERLQALKEEKLSELVGRCREQIRELFDELMFGDSDRKVYASTLESEEYTEEHLEEHEKLVAALSERLEVLLPVLKGVRRYFSLCEERIEYERLIQDSSRLLSRKRGKQQVEEEQMRKRVDAIPRFIEKLKTNIETYEKAHGEFFFEDERFLLALDRLEAEHANKKKEERLARMREKQEKKENSMQGNGRTPLKKGSSIRGTPKRHASTLGSKSRKNDENVDRN